MKERPPQETGPQVEFPELAEEILKMAEEDQAMRFGTLEGKAWDPDLDAKNTARMKEIIDRIGWPTKAKVGAEASHMAWLLIQHADKQPDFQRDCLDLMSAAPDGEVEKRDFAYLTDRVQLREKGTQRYGTQFRRAEDGGFDYYPIEDEEHLDERRAALDLEPFAEYQARMVKKNEELDKKRRHS